MATTTDILVLRSLDQLVWDELSRFVHWLCGGWVGLVVSVESPVLVHVRVSLPENFLFLIHWLTFVRLQMLILFTTTFTLTQIGLMLAPFLVWGFALVTVLFWTGTGFFLMAATNFLNWMTFGAFPALSLLAYWLACCSDACVGAVWSIVSHAPPLVVWGLLKTLTRAAGSLLKNALLLMLALIREVVYIPWDCFQGLLGLFLCLRRGATRPYHQLEVAGVSFFWGRAVRRWPYQNARVAWLLVALTWAWVAGGVFPVLLPGPGAPFFSLLPDEWYGWRVGYERYRLPTVIYKYALSVVLGALAVAVDLELTPPIVARALGVDQETIPHKEWEAFCRGKQLAKAEGVEFVSSAGARGRVPRLRARGALACRVQNLLGGGRGVVASVLRGRWTPDLPSQDRTPAANALLEAMDRGVKVLGVGTFPTHSGKEGDFWLIEHRDGRSDVVPISLYARLRMYATFRKRDAKLREALRSRAVEWYKRVECPDWVSLASLPGVVALAYATPAYESDAMARMVALEDDTPTVEA